MKKLLKACLQHFYRGGVQYNRLLSSFLFLALLFVFSCKNQTNSQTDKPNIPPDIPPKQNEIVITVSGDSNVKVAQSPSFNVLKNSTWADVKVKVNQKISFSDGFVLKSWHLTNKDGKLLVDSEVFTENTTVFAVSEKENIPEESEKPVKDEDGNEIKEEIIGEEGKDKEVKAIIEVVEVKEEGKEKPTTKLKISGNILSGETKRIADILRSKIYEYKNKKDELKNIQFDSVASNSTLNIQFKDESKKINVEDLKILVAKIPNQVKIDNEDCITLDKSANITSIKGTVSLKNIVKGANSNSELTKWEFISDKINTAKTSVNSTALNITSTEKDAFTKENLKKVANTLSKTEITNTTTNGNQTVTLGQDAKIFSINGNIALKDIVEAKNETDTELANYIAYKLKNTPNTERPSGNLKINTFYKKPSTIQGSSLSLRGNNNEGLESTPITPSNLKDIKNSAFNIATFNFEYNGQIQDVKFKSKEKGITEEQKQKDYFDITDFSKDISTGMLKDIQNIPEDKIKGNIFLRGDRLEERQGRKDTTPYPKVSELVSLVQNEKLSKKINIGSVILAGNVKYLLKYFVDGTIKESDGGIRFVDYGETLCTGDLKTGFLGKNNDILPANQLIEYYKRADNNSIQIENAIITGLDQETTKNIEFVGDMLTNVNFQGCDLSKLSFAVTTGNGYLKFENSILPMSMSKSVVYNLILKDVKFPKEKIMQYINESQVGLRKLNSLVPLVKYNLEIYGYVNDSPLNDLTSEQLDELVRKKQMPKIYKGPEGIYNKLKTYIYKGESKTINGQNNPNYTGNTTGSLNIHKPQDQLLAILKRRQERSHG